MDEERIFYGKNEEEVWNRLDMDLQEADLLHYKAAVEQGTQKVYLDIDIDPGGGFESGFSTTILSAPLRAHNGFRFAVHTKHITDAIGKLFGMQDVVIGYADFDDKLIIKTNNEAKVKSLFSDASVRAILLSLPYFTLEITEENVTEGEQKINILRLYIEEAITQPARLRPVYHTFMQLLQWLDEA